MKKKILTILLNFALNENVDSRSKTNNGGELHNTFESQIQSQMMAYSVAITQDSHKRFDINGNLLCLCRPSAMCPFVCCTQFVCSWCDWRAM